MIPLLSRLFPARRERLQLVSDVQRLVRERDEARAEYKQAMEWNVCQIENVAEGLRMVEELRREAAMLRRRLADRCVGFEAHPDSRYADYCVAPVYVGDRPTTCDMPRDAHREPK